MEDHYMCILIEKCLNDGQNYEVGFSTGLRTSQVIALLMSNTTIQLIQSKAHEHQDNVLIEYECSLVINKLYGVPVFPIFLAEKDNNTFVQFKFDIGFPDVPHQRSKSAQQFIDELSKSLPESEKEFLGSIKQTMELIFKMQGAFMNQRAESAEEMNNLVQRILDLVEISKPVASRNKFPLSHTAMERSDNANPLSSSMQSVPPQLSAGPILEEQEPSSAGTTIIEKNIEQGQTLPETHLSFTQISESTMNPIKNPQENLFNTRVVVLSVVIAVGVTLVWAIYRQNK